MLDQLSCIIVEPDGGDRRELAALLAERGVSVLAAEAELDRLPGLLQASGAAAQVALVNIDPRPHDALSRVGPWVRQFSGTAFFLMSRLVDAGLLMEAMRAGVREFVPLPVNPEALVAGLERLAATVEGSAAGGTQRAKVMQFVPTAGGSGATTVACNVGAALAKKGARTLLIDLDLARGGVANAFDLTPRYSVADLMDPGTTLDRALLENAVAVHKGTGLAVLGRPEAPEDARKVDGRGLARLIRTVERVYDYVLIDSAMDAGMLYVAAAKAAAENVLVMQLNVPSARNTQRAIGALQRGGVGMESVRVVVNRFAKKGNDLEPAEVERALGMKIAWTVPNDFRSAIGAINFGEPSVLRYPRAEISDSLTGLSHLLNGHVAGGRAAAKAS